MRGTWGEGRSALHGVIFFYASEDPSGFTAFYASEDPSPPKRRLLRFRGRFRFGGLATLYLGISRCFPSGEPAARRTPRAHRAARSLSFTRANIHIDFSCLNTFCSQSDKQQPNQRKHKDLNRNLKHLLYFQTFDIVCVNVDFFTSTWSSTKLHETPRNSTKLHDTPRN